MNPAKQLVAMAVLAGVVLIPMQTAMAQERFEQRIPAPDPTILAEARSAAEILGQKSDAGIAKPADVAAFRANLAVLFHHADAIKLTEAHEQMLRSHPEITKAFLERPVIAGKLEYEATYVERFAVTEFVRQYGVHALQERILDGLQVVVDQDFSARRLVTTRLPVPPYLDQNVCHDLQEQQTMLDYMALFLSPAGYLVVATIGAAAVAVWQFRLHYC